MRNTLACHDPQRLIAAGLLLSAVFLTGCQGGTGIIRRWSMQGDATMAKPITDEELGDNRGMVTRWLNPEKAPHTGGKTNISMSLAPSKPDPETEAQIQAAEDLFQQGRLAEAEKAFTKLDPTKANGTGKVEFSDPAYDISEKDDTLWRRITKGKLVGTRKRGAAPWGEKVLFYLAESQYQQGKFVAANDSYEKLLNTYPGSPHLDKAVEREYAIAQDWLATAPASDPNAPKDDAVRQASWLDHFNGRKPTVDVDGYAIKALEHVRQHDPTGPLADDAALALADHYMKKEDYESASAHYDQLIADHPKSPLLQRGMLGSIDAKIRSYLGPEYDADCLEKARVLITQVMSIFPERSEELTKKLENDLNLISDQQAEIAFKKGEFYKRTGYVSGAEMSFGEVRARWPKSPWAQKAEVQMASLAKMKRKEVLPSRILTLPGAPDPSSQGSSPGTMGSNPGGMGGMPAGAGP